ncbi:hypothetical protein EXIGLDRAFT_415755 [Exidia glandulosa HHB12029]|uniref:Uncharacterized protein n=1 Tax=Exidia glandulosa HHB12029 TaxID=1314781 RepID=A0A165PRS4_EXIGL|nr:hypothetical protein EXIGLDRAFT_415755 [Exidia glandulosa HHB12029]
MSLIARSSHKLIPCLPHPHCPSPTQHTHTMTSKSGIPNRLPDIRRVVIEHGPDGRSRVRSDGPLTNIKAEAAFEGRSLIAWATDGSPAKDNNSDEDGAERRIPGLGLVPKGGTNFRYTDFAPNAEAAMVRPTVWGSSLSVRELTGASQHRTASVDYNILLVGELIHTTEDGDERVIKAGDIVIQRGTLHGWRNPSDTQWARMLSVLVDGEAAVVNGQTLQDEWRGDVKMGE